MKIHKQHYWYWANLYWLPYGKDQITREKYILHSNQLTGQVFSLGVPRTRITRQSCSMSFSPWEKCKFHMNIHIIYCNILKKKISRNHVILGGKNINCLKFYVNTQNKHSLLFSIYTHLVMLLDHIWKQKEQRLFGPKYYILYVNTVIIVVF